MEWIQRAGVGRPKGEALSDAEDDSSQATERPAPGIAALFESIREDRSHSVLDLGAASNSAFELFSRFARQVRFADLIEGSLGSGTWNGGGDVLPAQPEHPYDLVFAWDILDRLLPEARPHLVQRLTEVTTGDAWLHVIVDASESGPTQPLRFTPLDKGRMRCEPSGPFRTEYSRILPAEMERLLSPFRVIRAFTLRGGLREYLATRRPARF